MYVMILIIKDEKKSKKIIQILMELSLYETTVLDGEGIENIAFKSIPLYSEIGKYFGSELSFNKTIISLVEDIETIEEFIRILESEDLSFKDGNLGKLMAFKAGLVY